MHRRAGRQPAGVQLDHRGPGRRPPLRRAARRRAARCRRAGAATGRRRDRPRRPDDDHRGHHPGRRGAPRRQRAWRGWPASWPPSPGCRRPAGPRRGRDDRPAHRRHAARRRGGRRTESRGCHRRADVPATRPEWEVRLVHRLDDAGRLHTRTEPVRTLAGARDRALGCGAPRARRRPVRGGAGPRRGGARSSAGHSRRTSPSAPTSRRSPPCRRGRSATGDIVPRSPGMLAGMPVAAAVFDLVGRGEVEVAPARRPTGPPPGPARPCSPSPVRPARCSPPSAPR